MGQKSRKKRDDPERQARLLVRHLYGRRIDAYRHHRAAAGHPLSTDDVRVTVGLLTTMLMERLEGRATLAPEEDDGTGSRVPDLRGYVDEEEPR